MSEKSLSLISKEEEEEEKKAYSVSE